MDYSQLSFFQFDNLVQNRIPFLLVNLGADLGSWYQSVWAMHIENNTLKTTAQNAIVDIKAKNLPPHYAIVVVDEDGVQAGEIQKVLEGMGFINSYSLRGGLRGMAQEKGSL